MSTTAHAFDSAGTGESQLPLDSLALGTAPNGGVGFKWLLRRIGAGLVVLWVVTVFVFVATQALPTNPAQAILGRYATASRVAALDRQLHLNQPVVTQYVDWLWRLLHLNLGDSLASQSPVSHEIAAPLVNSLSLLAMVAVIAIPISIAIGVLAAAKRDGAFDSVSLLGSLVTSTLPEFVIGLLLVVLLSTSILHLFPAVALIPPGSSPFQHLNEMVLPVVTLTIVVIPFLFRLTRASMIEVLASEYVACARLRGVPESRILRRHALPNALVPLVQASALTLSYLLGGIVLVEYVFNYPGLGTTLTSAISARDLPMIQAVVLVFTIGVVAFNLLADILTVVLTPKLRTSTGR